jgi:serine protease Do
MLKRKEFILGAAVGLSFAAAATAGGVISWPGANAEAPAVSGRLIPSAGAAGLAFAPPQGAPLSFADIFNQVAPAVVQINVETRIPRSRGGLSIPGLPFEFQLPPGAQGQTPEGEEEDEGATALGAGSGFFISGDGYIVTNNHVVENAEEITVTLADEREFTARLIGRDENTDLAVIKIEGGSFPFVSFEQAAEPRVGDWVIAVGNPFGLGGTATAGIVSGRARSLPDGGSSAYVDYLQIDAAINRGNSGGPTFDIYGRVIGVNTAIYSPTGGSVGIGFAIPAATAKSITDRLMRGETIERGYLGVEIGTLTSDQREALGLAADVKGAYVASITPGGPGDRAGLQLEDIVVALNGEPIDSSTELTRLVGAANAGDLLRMEVLREGRRQRIDVRAGRRPSEAELRAGQNTAEPEAATPAKPTGQTVEGMTVAPLTPAIRQRYSLPESVQTGVVVTGVEPRTAASRLGIPAGVVILRANNRTVTSAEELSAAIAAARAAGRPGVLLLIRTPSGNASVVLELRSAG